MLVIGLTGLPCSGKETVKDFIFALCGERGLKARHFSFSAEIRREALGRGQAEKNIDRDYLTRFAAEIRQQEGPAVLARRIITRVAEAPADVYVVEALRHPAEVETFRARFRDDFILVAVMCEALTMAERLIRRKRSDESRRAKQSLEDALQLIEQERRGDANVNVGAVMRMADLTVPNDGTLAELREAVQSRFAPLLNRLRISNEPPPTQDAGDSES